MLLNKAYVSIIKISTNEANKSFIMVNITRRNFINIENFLLLPRTRRKSRKGVQELEYMRIGVTKC